MCVTEHIVEAARETKKVEHQTRTQKRLLLRPATTLLPQSSAQRSGTLSVRTYTPRLSTPTLVSWPPGHVALRQTSGMAQHSDSAHPQNVYMLLGHVGVTAGPSVLMPSRPRTRHPLAHHSAQRTASFSLDLHAHGSSCFASLRLASLRSRLQHGTFGNFVRNTTSSVNQTEAYTPIISTQTLVCRPARV